jgi:ribonuclease BN (tRNA processing enzyme)
MRPSRNAEAARAHPVRLTVVGSGTSQPQPETPASGILVESETTAILIDCGQGTIRELFAIRDPRELDAIIVGHMHADHYIDLVSLRYLLPWEGVAGAHLPVLLPPGGAPKMRELASAISERPTFFDDAFGVLEYDPAHILLIGDLRISFVPGQHYVPAWGCTITDPDEQRIVISGDTGPNEGLVEAARGADLIVLEATLSDPDLDDPRRGHLTPEEAVDIADRAGVPQAVLVHFRANLQERVEHACARRPGAQAGRPGLVVDLGDAADRKLTDPAAQTPDRDRSRMDREARDGTSPDDASLLQPTEGIAGARRP